MFFFLQANACLHFLHLYSFSSVLILLAENRSPPGRYNIGTPKFYAQRQAVALLKALEPEIHMGQKSYQVIVGFGEKMDLKDSWNFEIIEERIEKFMSQNCLNSFLFFCHKI